MLDALFRGEMKGLGEMCEITGLWSPSDSFNDVWVCLHPFHVLACSRFDVVFGPVSEFGDTTRGARLVVIPKYSHTGHLEPHSEKMTYVWLWAIKYGYFL